MSSDQLCVFYHLLIALTSGTNETVCFLCWWSTIRLMAPEALGFLHFALIPKQQCLLGDTDFDTL